MLRSFENQYATWYHIGRFLLCLFLSLLPGLPVFAADSLTVVRDIPMQAGLMTVDETGNVYVVKQDNSLVRFNEAGDSTGFFRSVQNGSIGLIDATNPLKIAVYHPAYSRVVFLDRMLARQNELDLRRLNIPGSPVIATSADGKLWLYDLFNARVRKIDEQLNDIAQSNDLRQEAGLAPVPSFMVEREWKLFVCDTVRGILTFDRYANYINTIPLKGIRQLQVLGSQLIYRKGNTLLSWDMIKAKEQSVLIPGDSTTIIQASLVRDRLYVLYANRLVIYRLPG